MIVLMSVMSGSVARRKRVRLSIQRMARDRRAAQTPNRKPPTHSVSTHLLLTIVGPIDGVVHPGVCACVRVVYAVKVVCVSIPVSCSRHLI